MQHNVPAAIFHLAQYSVCSSRFRCAARHSVACFFTRAHCCQHTVFFHACVLLSTHKNMHYARQHRVRSAHLPHFGEMFQRRKSWDCCFGALICICIARRRQFNARRHQFLARAVNFWRGAVNFWRGAVNFTRGFVFFTRAARAVVFCACATTDGSSKFWSFLLCEIICRNG